MTCPYGFFPTNLYSPPGSLLDQSCSEALIAVLITSESERLDAGSKLATLPLVRGLNRQHPFFKPGQTV